MGATAKRSRAGPKRRTAKKAAKLRVVASHGERVDETVVSTEAESAQPDQTEPEQLTIEAPDCPSMEVAAVVVDRDKLRALRLSPAAEAVFAKSKGDAALAAIKSRKGGPDHMHRVNPYDLHFEDDNNPRDFTTDEMRQRVAGFADSVATRGVRQPLDVYVKNNRICVNGGETRWRATLHAINFLNVPIEGVPVIISHGENDAERLISQWLGNDANRLLPIEEAKVFRRYLDHGGDLKVFSSRIGRPKAYLEDRIKLLEMPGWLQQEIGTGAVAPRTAYELIWLPSGEDDATARRLLQASVEHADKEGAKTVRPRHVRAVETGDNTKIVRGRTADRLATILLRHRRSVIIQWFGEEDAQELFRMAKLAKLAAAEATE